MRLLLHLLFYCILLVWFFLLQELEADKVTYCEWAGHLTIDRHTLAVTGSHSLPLCSSKCGLGQYHWQRVPAPALNLLHFVFDTQSVFQQESSLIGFAYSWRSVDTGLRSMRVVCRSLVQVVCEVIRGCPVVGGASPRSYQPPAEDWYRRPVGCHHHWGPPL